MSQKAVDFNEPQLEWPGPVTVQTLIPVFLQASPSPSPVGYSPMTPGAPSPGGYNPHTPGSGIEQNSSDWVTTDIQVKVRDTYLDTQVVGQTGVIRSVTVSRILAGGQGPPTMYLLILSVVLWMEF